jgi:putative acetyltransferase
MIRTFRDDDAEALSEICRAAIAVIGPRKYSAAQVAAWLARHPSAERYRERHSAGHVMFVAECDAREPAGYALLEPDGHLDHLYCHPDHTRSGLAKRLLEAAETFAQEKGMTRLYTEASESAVGAFTQAGYVKKERRDFEIGGVPIHNYAMEKSLI